MGRLGIAMTFVTDQELGDLKSLFKMNRINPMWHGNIPNLQAVSKHNGRQDGKKYFKKRSQPVSKVKPYQITGRIPTPISSRQQEITDLGAGCRPTRLRAGALQRAGTGDR